MYIGDQKNTCVCQCGADCLNIMERIKITGESQNKRRTNPNSDTRPPSHGAGLTVVW